MVSYTTPPPSNAEHSHGPNPYDAAQTFRETGVSVSVTNAHALDGSVRLGAKSDIDTVADEDISEYSGDTSNFGITTSDTPPILESTAAITGSSVSGAQIYSGSGLPYYPSRPDTVVWYSKYSQSDDMNFFYIFTDSSRSKGYRFGHYNGSTSIYAVTNDTLVNVSDSYSGEWIRNEVRFTGTNNHDIEYTYTALDSDYTNTLTLTDGADDSGSILWDTNYYGNSASDVRYAYAYAFPGGAPDAGSVTVEWPYPTDIYEWDVATFIDSPDGETVDVYVAYNDGTGWTRTNGGNPITRNYSLANDSNISPSDEVRIEAELSRANTSNNPTLDSAIRSWRL